ncbi:hypothetical protein AXE65_08395 [Ventosimonas gracilis]|uniref:Uncharacterized protein n=1 Tax=Ventosimonas gracilis TaxID=1680762 RepID=A0A139SYK5_9GAMM|nr:hypothetical protein [Ventosimonas gracilis]KXU39511.1 hypothetical protein AXE65_08395 [Ventosimonas gracilis]
MPIAAKKPGTRRTVAGFIKQWTHSLVPLSDTDLDDFLNQAERFAFILRLSAKVQRNIKIDINRGR